MKISKLLNKVLSNFSINFKTIIIFEIVYKLLVFLMFTPLISFVLKATITEMGFMNLTNNELINLGIKLPGIIGIILIIILSFVVIFIEIGVLTYIANKSHESKKIGLIESILSTIKILPNTFGIYIVPILIICGIIGPIGGLGLSISLIKNISIPLFIKVELLRSKFGIVFLTLAIFLAIIISLRWILSIPIVIIEEITLKNALRKSRETYSKKKFKILKYIFIWLVVNIFTRLVMLYLYLLIGDFIIVGPMSAKLYFLLFIMGYTIISIITLPLFIIILVETYFECREGNFIERSIDINEEFKNKNKYHKFVVRYKTILGIITIILFILMIFNTSFNSIYDKNNQNLISVTAHRGNNKVAPENSIPSISESIEWEADYVEIDVMATKDNKVVLFHDSNLKRFDKSNRKIKNMTLDEVKKVDIGTPFDIKTYNEHGIYEGEQIPTLEEVFKEFKGKIKFNIELKPFNDEDTLPYEVAKIIKKYNMENEVIVSSLNYESLMKFKEENISIKVGYILTFGIGDISNIDVDFISVEYGMLSKQLIDTMHSLGKEVHVWTLNNSEEILNAAVLGVDNIITDEIWETIATLTNFDYREYESIGKNKVDYRLWLLTNVNCVLKYVNI